MRGLHRLIAVELRKTCLAVAFVVPLPETASLVAGKIFGTFLGDANEHLVDLEFIDKVVNLSEFGKAAQSGIDDHRFHFI